MIDVNIYSGNPGAEPVLLLATHVAVLPRVGEYLAFPTLGEGIYRVHTLVHEMIGGEHTVYAVYIYKFVGG